MKITTFKSFLTEKFNYESELDNDEAIVFILNKNCSQSRWMAVDNSPIYRGDSSMYGDNVKVLNLNTVRKSKNTTNYYTLIFDNIPSMKDFPKRSKSLICTTSKYKAGLFGETYVVIPFDNTAIGSVNVNDMWNVEVDVLSQCIFSNIDYVNRFWYYLNMDDSNNAWKKWEKFAKDCKNPDTKDKCKEQLANAIRLYSSRISKDKIPALADKMADDFIGYIDSVYSPEHTGFTLLNSSNLEKYMQSDSEVWMSGKVVIIPLNKWDNIRLMWSKNDDN